MEPSQRVQPVLDIGEVSTTMPFPEPSQAILSPGRPGAAPSGR
jgi:hypothetical protein